MTNWPQSWELLSDLKQSEYFGAYLRNYWRNNVKKHFSKSSNNYPDGASNAEYTYITYRAGLGGGRLQDALVFKWYPNFNTVYVNVKPMMVYKFNQETRYDLIKYLSVGTPSSPRKYVVALNKRPRWGGGTRKGTTNEQWISWWNEFLPIVDVQVNKLADVATHHIANKFVKYAKQTLAGEIS